ncbi:MAG: hypothetical protein ABFC67_14750 [Mizugakiibacter sp.]|uniref:hypothetical protein n=1 Tax=Mizugakiibacter sp. TaxID=1972610 RepID=UPI0032114CC3
MSERYINDIRAARLIAGDFLAANPRQHGVIVSQGKISLRVDQAGNERVITHAMPCATCEHDIAVCEDGGACQINGKEFK